MKMIVRLVWGQELAVQLDELCPERGLVQLPNHLSAKFITKIRDVLRIPTVRCRFTAHRRCSELLLEEVEQFAGLGPGIFELSLFLGR